MDLKSETQYVGNEIRNRSARELLRLDFYVGLIEKVEIIDSERKSEAPGKISKKCSVPGNSEKWKGIKPVLSNK